MLWAIFVKVAERLSFVALAKAAYGKQAAAVKVRVREVRLIPRTRVGRTDQGLNKR